MNLEADSAGVPTESRPRIQALQFLQIILPLIMVGFVVSRWNLESHLGLPRLFPVVIATFAVHSLVKRAWRPPLYFFSSVGTILYLLGVMEGMKVVLCGLALIATCHLPCSRRVILVLIVFQGAVLAALRALARSGALLPFQPNSQALSCLGALFMFRLIIYLYDLPHEKEKVSPWQRLNYFFLLPNICFPIFPVVDYRAFKRCYYSKPEYETYSRGLYLVVLGVIQLVAYRFLYQAVPAQSSVSNLTEFFQFTCLAYLMLIRFSGILQLAVGLLCLYGLYLPDIFKFMFFADGFGDLWRRVNIYWKDFVVKIVYFPSYLKFKRKNATLALILATAATFTANWFFHSYQWFWAIGTFPLRDTEIAVWSILGVLVLVSSLKQKESTRKTSASGNENQVLRHLRIALTFVSMSLIYSLFISDSLSEWFSLIGRAYAGSTVYDCAYLVGGGFFFMLFGQVLTLLNLARISRYVRSGLVLAVLPLFILTTKPAYKAARAIGYSLKPVIKHRLNAQDTQKQSLGYYEDMMLAGQFNSPLWQLEKTKPDGWGRELHLARREGYFSKFLEPSASTVFKGAKISTNSWGIRDRDYTLVPPKNAFRIALVGGSAEFGVGVEQEQVFEHILEERLNQESGSGRTELINFSISGQKCFRTVEAIRLKVLKSNPNHILLFAHDSEQVHAFRALQWCENEPAIQQNLDDVRRTIPWFSSLERRVKLEDLDSFRVDERDRIGWSMVDWTYENVARLSAEHNVEVTLVYLPDLRPEERISASRFRSLAQKHGFDYVDLSKAFNTATPEELRLRTWDWHPNSLGHQLIAVALEPELRRILASSRMQERVFED